MIFSNFSLGNLRVKVAEYPIIRLFGWPPTLTNLTTIPGCYNSPYSTTTFF